MTTPPGSAFLTNEAKKLAKIIINRIGGSTEQEIAEDIESAMIYVRDKHLDDSGEKETV